MMMLHSNPDSEGQAQYTQEMTKQFYHNLELSDMYYVFHGIHCFIEQPFTSYMPEALLNMARYLIQKTLKNTPKGISRVYP